MLERNSVSIRVERPARKEPLDDAAVRKLLKGVSQVVIAKGKKAETYASKDVKPAMLKGPTGSVRAPLLVRGKKMLVGFSADTLEAWLA